MVSVQPLYPAMSSSNNINNNNDTISVKSTPWSLVKARVHVSVAPQSLNDIQAAATRQAYANLLLRYNTDLGGVVAAIKGALKLDPSPKLIDASPFLHVSATATMLLFSPKPGCVLRGVVNYVGPDHVGMSVHGVFHAVLPIDDAAPFYQYAGANERCWRYQYNVDDEDSNETNSNGGNTEDDDDVNAQRNGSLRLCSKTDIYMDATIRFVVTSVKSTKSGLFQVLASLMHAHESHRETALDESTPSRNTPNSSAVLLGVVDADDDDEDGGGDDDNDDGDSVMDTDTNTTNSYLHHHQGHNYRKHKLEDGVNLDMNMPNNNNNAYDRTDPDGDNNDDASENENEDSGPTGDSSPTSSLLVTPHQTPPSMPHGGNMRADKPNNGVGAKSPGTTSPKMIAKVTAKRSLFQRSGGFGSAFGSAFSGQRPSTTVNEDAEVAADGEKDTTTTVTKAQSFDGLTTTAGGNFKMSDDNFDVNEKKTSGRTHNDRNEDDVDDENNNNNVNKNVNNEWDENDSALTLSEKSRRKKEKREKKEKKKKKKKVEKPAHKENSNGGRYFSTERGENEREVAKAKDAKSKGNAKDKGQSKVDVNVDNDEDEDNSNISRVLTQLDASAARKHKTEALLKTYNHTNHARRMYDDDGNEMDDGDDEVLVPETQEEEDPKQPHTNVTQVSQSVAAKAREGEDIPVASSLSPVVKSQKKKKVSKSKSMDRMGAGDDPQRERTNKRKRRSSLNLSPVGEGGGENGEGGNDGMVGNFSHTTEQQRHKKKRKKQNSSTNSAVQLHRGR